MNRIPDLQIDNWLQKTTPYFHPLLLKSNCNHYENTAATASMATEPVQHYHAAHRTKHCHAATVDYTAAREQQTFHQKP